MVVERTRIQGRYPNMIKKAGTARGIKKKRYDKLVFRNERERKRFELLRNIYDDRFLDMDAGDEYEADDEEYEDAEEELASELAAEV